MSAASDPVEKLPGLRTDGSGAAYCGVSTGSLDWSLFDPILLGRNIAARAADPGSTTPLHPGRCGPCGDCREFLRTRKARRRAKLGLELALSEREQERRARARQQRLRKKLATLEQENGEPTRSRRRQLEMELARLEREKPARTRQRRTTTELREQVLELDRRGMVRSAIADVLNLSDRRVAEILAKCRKPGNGVAGPLNHAEKSAAKGGGRPTSHSGQLEPLGAGQRIRRRGGGQP
jgi:hypothetical protein